MNRLYYIHINTTNVKYFNIPFHLSLFLLPHLFVQYQQLQLLFQHQTALILTHSKTTRHLLYLKQWQYLYPNRKNKRGFVVRGLSETLNQHKLTQNSMSSHISKHPAFLQWTSIHSTNTYYVKANGCNRCQIRNFAFLFNFESMFIKTEDSQNFVF